MGRPKKQTTAQTEESEQPEKQLIEVSEEIEAETVPEDTKTIFKVTELINFLKEHDYIDDNTLALFVYFEPYNCKIHDKEDKENKKSYSSVLIKPVFISIQDKNKQMKVINHINILELFKIQPLISYTVKYRRPKPVETDQLWKISIKNEYKEYLGYPFYPTEVTRSDNAKNNNIILQQIQSEHIDEPEIDPDAL